MAEVIIRPDALVGTATGFDTDLDTVAGLGKINDDILGQKYEEGLIKENVKFLYKKKSEKPQSRRVLIRNS